MKRRSILAAAAAACVVASGAWAQPAAYPSRTVTLVVPYAPGGLPDTVARVIGQKLSEKWGQAVVVENKPGGNGAVSAQALAAKPADGYTLMVTDMSMFAINPFVYPSLPYDPQKDFTFISLTARAPLFLAVHPSVPANNFQEWIALAKSKPGELTYGSSGIGSIHHLTVESIKSSLGVDLLHIPFKGTGQSVPAVVAGQVSAVFSAYPSLAGVAKENKLKLIAVNSEKRSALAPEILSIAETSIAGFDFAPTIGFSGPAGVPDAIANKIAADVADVIKDPALVERLRVLGIDPIGSTPQQYAAQIRADRERYGRAVKLANIKGE
ncbi:MAG: tripartite tricarboxylate transporter substrate binding protein [Burkholderiales bacterium]|nr:tripartite tricarboxylate transporter substrate binding protein [Burkholderiales bacterium]